MVQDVIILAGGFGKRLEQVSQGVPKPLVQIGSRVFLDYILEWLDQFDIKRVLLSLHFKPELFLSYIEKCHYIFDIVPVIEQSPMGTGGAVKHVMDNLKVSNPFCVLNGDTYLRFNLNEMFQTFRETKSNAMIGLTHVPDAGRFGMVTCEGNKVISYSEKIDAHPGWINNGCYFFDTNIFDSRKGKFSIEMDMFPELVGKKLLFAHKTNGEFLDIGVPEDCERFVKLFSR